MTVALAAARAAAQCPMCGKSAEFAGGGQGQAYGTLFTAALVLLVPTLLLLGSAGVLIWKYRDADGRFGGARPEAPVPSAAPPASARGGVAVSGDHNRYSIQ